MLRHIHARSEQSLVPNTLTIIRQGDRVSSVHAARTGIVVKVYPDGSAAVRWDDGDPQPEDLAHERMPRALFDVIEQRVSDALRTAALAPTLSDALDVAGAALSEIADMARSGAPTSHTSSGDDSLVRVREVADETLHVFYRIASLLDAIERLAHDSDDAIADLAAMGRGLVAKQTDRVDLLFTCVARRVSAQGAHHG